MIDEIQVENIALIRSAHLAPARGLTVLTGETGAGKTALISACKLLMGARADKAMVREGAREAVVQGRFFLPAAFDSVAGVAEDAVLDVAGTAGDNAASDGVVSDGTLAAMQRGVAAAAPCDVSAIGSNAAPRDAPSTTPDVAPNVTPARVPSNAPASSGAVGHPASSAPDEEREVVAVRRLSADGRSRVNINGTMASVSQLVSEVAPSIDLCGQHEYQALMRASSHVGMLDAWAADTVKELAAAYRCAYAAADAAARELDRILEGRTSSQAQLDEARFTLRQIDAVSPQQGEYEELVAYLGKAEHAELLVRSADGVYRALSSDGGALDGLGAAIAQLDEGARVDKSLEPFAQSLREASYVLEDVAREALSYRDNVEYDAEELAQAQERVAAMQGLMRSYGPRMEDVMEARERAFEAVSLVDDAQERERAARKAHEQAEAQLAEAARQLHEARAAAAQPFARAVSEVMGRLEMGSAELVCQVDELDRASWTQTGPSVVEFFFRSGAGMQPRPLARIASGGEMSRVMLAVHVVMGERDNVQTLVFDEVDAGVGGATAVALAGVIADLARTHQVIVISHLAQVAVAADAHYVVEKTSDDVPETTLREVTGQDRVREVARMLSGSATDASLAHARELLANTLNVRV